MYFVYANIPKTKIYNNDGSLLFPQIIKKITKSAYKEAFPVVPPVIKIKSTGEQVKKLQKFLNWYGDYGLTVDGDCGEKTTKAIKMFQKAEKLTVDGEFGPKSLAAAKTIKK